MRLCWWNRFCFFIKTRSRNLRNCCLSDSLLIKLINSQFLEFIKRHSTKYFFGKEAENFQKTWVFLMKLNQNSTIKYLFYNFTFKDLTLLCGFWVYKETFSRWSFIYMRRKGSLSQRALSIQAPYSWNPTFKAVSSTKLSKSLLSEIIVKMSFHLIRKFLLKHSVRL